MELLPPVVMDGEAMVSILLPNEQWLLDIPLIHID
jgi:hypothetical protein